MRNHAGWWNADARAGSTIYQRIGISREYLSVVVIHVVEKKIGGSYSVPSCNGGEIHLGDAREDNALTGANDERPLVADGISQSGAWGEVQIIGRHTSGL